MNLAEQREFILAGNMYNDLTPELVEAREKAFILNLCFAVNLVITFLSETIFMQILTV